MHDSFFFKISIKHLKNITTEDTFFLINDENYFAKFLIDNRTLHFNISPKLNFISTNNVKNTLFKCLKNSSSIQFQYKTSLNQVNFNRKSINNLKSFLFSVNLNDIIIVVDDKTITRIKQIEFKNTTYKKWYL